ncbi:MAG: TaqI-like C-terminal specificity domain-containing protein [Thermoanaerobaculia bacterium]
MSQIKLPSQKDLVRPEDLDAIAAKVRTRPDWETHLIAAKNWAAAYSRNRLETTKEKSLQSTFLQRVFVDILGYLDQGHGPGYWTLEAEPSTDVDARFPDGRIGFFTPYSPPVTRAVIELKDALTDLDAKQMDRRDRLSPVEQSFLYLVRYEEAAYAIVSNFRSLRLYARRFGMARYREFDLTRIGDPQELSMMLALCGPSALVGDDPTQPAPLDSQLSGDLPKPQEEITEAFYKIYAAYRDRLVHYVAENYPRLRQEAVTYGQKLLDRILFILHAQARGFLPYGILGKTLDHAAKSRSRSRHKIWDELLFLFEDIDKGRTDLDPSINRYNGGLFASDPVLDGELKIPDDLLVRIRQFERFDFESEIDVNILGHVFENSIADIELLRREFSLDPHEADRLAPAADAQRREFGVFYTPNWVTHFIIDHTLGSLIQRKGPESRLAIRIFDPSCGSGAFLSEALSYLGNYSRMLAAQAITEAKPILFEQVAGAGPADHLNQLFGIDLLPEAVEISKLSLWLKSTARNTPLTEITNIVTGNTLLTANDPKGYLNTGIGDALGEGFDVVVGNPPWGAKITYNLDEGFWLAKGQFDSYELFIERSLKNFLAANGLFGFIVPDRILRPEGERSRRFLFDNYKVLLIVKLGEGVFPGVFRACVILIVQKTTPNPNDCYTGLVIVKEDREALDRTGTAQLTNLITQRGGLIAASRVKESHNYDIPLFPDIDLAISDLMASGTSDWTGPGGIFSLYGRGEELGRDSIVVQCPSCFSWSIGPRTRAERRGGGYENKECRVCGLVFTVDQALAIRQPVLPAYNPDSPNQVPLFAGEQVNRYWTDPPFALDLGVQGITHKDAELYEGPKILIRQTGVGIYAAIDDSSSRCMQSVYIYKTRRDDDVAMEFYLAQLNSRAMLFYYYILTNQVEWQSFPKLTHETLRKLPLWKPDLTKPGSRKHYDKIVNLVKQRLDLAAKEKRNGPSNEALAVDLEIERLVMDLYSLNPDQRLRISERLKSSQNIRIVRELYPSPDHLLNPFQH